ncbi:hypothetical protein P7K49_032725 [Saguinus oedipus]|uniref:Large ribosomal subunit protein eL8 n=1 Tax=Saguinus oedipus TaxID=9490 RepID=A0ABQ9TPV8_SAGOE|nr:hypothetical protein P7K49_032725 [Saguinus oedipus]
MPTGKEAKGKQEAKKVDIQPKRDLTRFVKWPRYIRLQRQRATLHKRLKVPPAINQFTQALDRHTATQLLKLAHKYRPERKQEKKQRLLARAEKKAAGKGDVPTERPPVRAGVNTITTLVENKKAQLVVTAHHVDPIELAVFLPALCCKMGVPYCVIQGKARLGRLVHRKTRTTVAFTQVNAEDKGALAKLVEAIRTNSNDRYDEIRLHWGGSVLGPKSVARIAKLEKAKAKELAAKLGSHLTCLPRFPQGALDVKPAPGRSWLETDLSLEVRGKRDSSWDSTSPPEQGPTFWRGSGILGRNRVRVGDNFKARGPFPAPALRLTGSGWASPAPAECHRRGPRVAAGRLFTPRPVRAPLPPRGCWRSGTPGRRGPTQWAARAGRGGSVGTGSPAPPAASGARNFAMEFVRALWLGLALAMALGPGPGPAGGHPQPCGVLARLGGSVRLGALLPRAPLARARARAALARAVLAPRLPHNLSLELVFAAPRARDPASLARGLCQALAAPGVAALLAFPEARPELLQLHFLAAATETPVLSVLRREARAALGAPVRGTLGAGARGTRGGSGSPRGARSQDGDPGTLDGPGAQGWGRPGCPPSQGAGTQRQRPRDRDLDAGLRARGAPWNAPSQRPGDGDAASAPSLPTEPSLVPPGLQAAEVLSPLGVQVRGLQVRVPLLPAFSPSPPRGLQDPRAAPVTPAPTPFPPPFKFLSSNPTPRPRSHRETE